MYMTISINGAKKKGKKVDGRKVNALHVRSESMNKLM